MTQAILPNVGGNVRALEHIMPIPTHPCNMGPCSAYEPQMELELGGSNEAI